MQARVQQQSQVQLGASGNMAVGGRWKVLGRIGSQPYGSVYEANDTIEDHRVELEVIRAELFHSMDFWAISEFLDIHLAPVQNLTHSTIDPLISFGVHEGLAYLAYEKASTFTLRSLLSQQSRLPVATVKEIAEHVLLSLIAAHRSGVYHFSLSPERIILSLDSANSRIAVVRGFGLAAGLASRHSNMALLTRTGVPLAPPQYMSPELFASGTPDQRSDLYSLGAILYEMLTGHVPVSAESPIDILLKLKTEPLVPIANHCPEYAGDPFCAFVERLLERSPVKRPNSADICYTALQGLPQRNISIENKNSEKSNPFESFDAQIELNRQEQQASGIQSESGRQRRKRNRGVGDPYASGARDEERISAGRKRNWLGPVLLAAVLLNGVLGMLLLRSNLRDREVSELARIEQSREAEKIASEEASRARLTREDSPSASVAASVVQDTKEKIATSKGSQATTRKQIQADKSGKLGSKTISATKTSTTETPTTETPATEIPATGSSAKVVAKVANPVSFAPRRIRALGITVRKVDREFINAHSLLNAEGLLVAKSEEGSPAYQAGLRENDILQYTETAGQSILSWQPEPLTHTDELVRAVERSKESGTRLALIIKRGSFDGLVVFIRDFIE